MAELPLRPAPLAASYGEVAPEVAGEVAEIEAQVVELPGREAGERDGEVWAAVVEAVDQASEASFRRSAVPPPVIRPCFSGVRPDARVVDRHAVDHRRLASLREVHEVRVGLVRGKAAVRVAGDERDRVHAVAERGLAVAGEIADRAAGNAHGAVARRAHHVEGIVAGKHELATAHGHAAARVTGGQDAAAGLLHEAAVRRRERAREAGVETGIHARPHGRHRSRVRRHDALPRGLRRAGVRRQPRARQQLVGALARLLHVEVGVGVARDLEQPEVEGVDAGREVTAAVVRLADARRGQHLAVVDHEDNLVVGHDVETVEARLGDDQIGRIDRRPAVLRLEVRGERVFLRVADGERRGERLVELSAERHLGQHRLVVLP